MRSPFSRRTEDLGSCELGPIDGALAQELGDAISEIEPWVVMNYPAERLSAFLTWSDPSTHQFAIYRENAIAGAVAVRHPWLHGPYLQLLAILPSFQRKGIGSAIIRWIESEVEGQVRNFWVIASDFNQPAIDFYLSHGFRHAAKFENLVQDGFDELLLRKRLT
jgi:ribosomal protein S18 acetylase RimI-like enzyme